MKFLTIIGIIALTVIVFSCTLEKGNRNSATFSIAGQVIGFVDSTYLFLDNSITKQADSAMILEGRFMFTGSIPDSIPSMQVVLRTKNFSDYTFFWIENANITFTVEKGKFREAKITGSATQAEAYLYMQAVQFSENEFDSLYMLIDNPGLSMADQEELAKKLEEADVKKKNVSSDFIKKHPASLISAYVLSVYASTWGRQLTMKLYTGLSVSNKNSDYGKSVNRYLALNADLKPGDHFIDFKQNNSANVAIKLSDFEGKFILLEFWASWCGPCRQENPALVETYKAYKNKGFEILGVSLDDNKESWLKAIEKDGLLWENVSELNGDKNSAALIYGVSAIPDNLLIDRDGIIVDRNLRGDRLAKRLNDLLN